MSAQVFLPLFGGVVIGVAASLMLIFNGRVTGISGILGRILALPGNDLAWRFAFVAGLIAGGFALRNIDPQIFVNTTERSSLAIAFAGLAVGIGTLMGSGCTSGHGVCGISRFSTRSIFATMTFILFGVLTVAAVRALFGGRI